MRIGMAMLLSMVFISASAQQHLPIPVYPYGAWQPFWQPAGFSPMVVPFGNPASHLQVVPYASVSAGFIILHGGISYLSAPVGLAVLRPLNNNLTAFSSLSLAPTFFSMHQLYTSPAGPSPWYGNEFGFSTRLEGGLMFTNDARTFSISGSFSVQRDSYPVYVPAAPPKSYRVY